MNTPVINEDGQEKMLLELMVWFEMQMEKKFMSFMVNGMKLSISETKKLKKNENFGD